MADRLTMDGPAACVIRVGGALAPHVAARLGGLQITLGAGRAGTEATSELRGELDGQAALLGVLETLHALGLPLLRVDCAPAPAGAAD